MRQVLIIVFCLLTACTRPEPADLLLTDTTVYTVNPKRPVVEAVAVRGGRIVALGTADELRRYVGADTEVLDLAGSFVYPGFTDSHVHLSGVGARELTLNLDDVASLKELLARVTERVAHSEPGEWIAGRGWIETHWDPPVFPMRRDLDAVAPDNPVYLERADGHAAVANSAALARAGITADTAAPFGGEILHAEDGTPTGMLIDNAQDLVTRHIPAATDDTVARYLETGAQRYAELGWTGLHNISDSLNELRLLRDLFEQDRIGIRTYNAVRGPGEDARALINDKDRLAAYGDFNGKFTLRTVKVSVDGALGSRGAALLESYADYATSGFLTWEKDDLLPLYRAALEAGIQIETHAIGDYANRFVLNLYEQVLEAVPPDQRAVAAPRWRIEHAQILHADDLPRFAALDVIPSMQPSHAIGDLYFAPRRLGLARLAGAYAWRDLLDTGVVIPCGSDAPVEKGDPRIEFYAAVARKGLNGFQGEGWHPEQTMTREQALQCLTLWPAYAAFEEDVRGSIEPGKYADFTVFDRDIMRVPEAGILEAQVVMTVVGGDIVYRR